VLRSIKISNNLNCIVDPMKVVAWKDKKALAQALERIYDAPDV
jgi:hypothetical protein